MTNFDRIQRQPQQHGGQAQIRETGITVNEIVRHALAGMPLPDLLQRYPNLEADDIYQALAYSVHDLLNGIAYWRHEGVAPLSHIKGYSEILAGHSENLPPETLSDEMRQEWSQVILNASRSALSSWDNVRTWATRSYAQDAPPLASMTISDLMEALLDHLRRVQPSASVHISAPDDTPPVRASAHLVEALTLLVTSEGNLFKPRAELGIRALGGANDEVRFGVRRELAYARDQAANLLKLSATPISTAMLIIHQHGSHLNIRRKDAHIIFEFSLKAAPEDESSAP